MRDESLHDKCMIESYIENVCLRLVCNNLIKDGPGGGYGLFLKKYSDSQCC